MINKHFVVSPEKNNQGLSGLPSVTIKTFPFVKFNQRLLLS